MRLRLPFEVSVRLVKGDVAFTCEGRGFTLHELKRSAIAAAGGYVNEWYFRLWGMPVWEIIEAIEIVASLQSQPSKNRDIDEALT